MNPLSAYATHLPTCNVNRQDLWDEAQVALTDIPPELRADPEAMWEIDLALFEIASKRVVCTCGLDKLLAAEVV